MAGPLEQFKIKKVADLSLFGIDISITNATIMLFVVTGSIMGFFFLASRSVKLIPSRLQCMGEFFVNFSKNLVGNTVDSKVNYKYVPVVFAIFIFILFSNLFGMLPYSFTVTSHLALTFAIATIVFFVTLITIIMRKGFSFYKAFIPHGTPTALMPLMLLIEFFSYLIKPFTLSVRLAANMMAGHTVLKVIATFVAPLGLFGAMPLLFLSALTAFEIFIACLQAYIFSLLTCIYLNDALNH